MEEQNFDNEENTQANQDLEHYEELMNTTFSKDEVENFYAHFTVANPFEKVIEQTAC